MDEREAAFLSLSECADLFDALFPHGFGGADVFAEIAPEGWDHSPLRRIAHPTKEQMLIEARQLHESLLRLRRPDDPRPPPPAPTLDDLDDGEPDGDAGDPVREVRELTALCLWDLFSDNHDVMAPDGRVADIGSFRGAAGFLAERLNQEIGEPMDVPGDGAFDYIDFYMGTNWIRGRADLAPVYRMIFRRLHANGCDWVYHAPVLRLFRFSPSHEPGKDVPNYDPSRAFGEEQASRDLNASLDEANRNTIERLRRGPPPTMVAAYNDVYGCFPKGWPPESDVT